MSHAKFITLTTLAVIPWSIVFVYLGFKLGTEWESINKVAAICEILCTCCYCLCNWLFCIKKMMKKVITEKESMST